MTTSADEQLANFRNEQLEKEIRLGLEQREKARYKEYLESHPEFVAEVEAMRSDAHKSLKDSLKTAALEIAEEEKKEIDAKIERLKDTDLYGNFGGIAVLNAKKSSIDTKLNGLDEEIEKAIDEDPQLKSLIDGISTETLYETAGGGYKSSYPETLRHVELAVRLASPSEVPVLNKTLGLTKSNAGYMRLNDIFVNRLAEIAKEKGIGHALGEDAIYSVKKWLLPTREEYQKHLEETRKLTADGLSLLYEAFNSQISAVEDAKEKTRLLAIGQSIAKMVEYNTRLTNKIDGELAELEMDRMYNKPSSLEMERARILEKYSVANNLAGKQ